MVGFADDLLNKHLVSTGKPKQAVNILVKSAGKLNEELDEHSFHQNNDKREIVPRLKGAKETRLFSKFLAAGSSGRVLGQARHLGGMHSFNGSNRVEFGRRARAMRVGSVSM